jgi:large repetitive protein
MRKLLQEPILKILFNNSTCVMNHLKFIQKAAVIALAVLAGSVSKVNAQTCPTSNEITVTVIPEATISISGAVTICSGGNATLTATPGGGTGTCTIAWQSSPDGTTWTTIAGETATTLNLTGLTATTQYRAIYTCSGSGCDPITSNSQTITVNPDLSITTNLTDITECIGGTTALNVVVANGTGTITYAWFSSPDGTTWSPIAGATTSSHTPPSATAGVIFYRVVVSASGSGCDNVTSASSRVEIVPDLSVSTQPTDLNQCVGGTATINVAITGGTGTISYQWEESNDGTTGWTAVGGATSATYAPPSATAGVKFYRAVISASGNGCGPTTSTAARVETIAVPTITAQPTDVTECVGGTLPISVTISGGTGTISYQWQSSPNGTSGWANIGGATSASYTPVSTADGTFYYRVIVSATGNGCGTVTSGTSTVTIVPDLVVSTQPADIDECVGGTVALTVATTGGTGTVTYQWEESNDGTTGWTAVAGATSASYTPPSATAGTKYYRAVVSASGNGCGPVTSGTATVIVRAKPTLVTTVSSGTICVGGTVTLNTVQTGGSGTCTIQWQTFSGGTWNDIPAATGTSYTTPPLSADSQYRAKVTCTGNGCCN